MATNCERCGGLVPGYHHGKRFCSPACSTAWHIEERRQALRWFRGLGMTPAREEDQQRSKQREATGVLKS
jgi:hypothetical protein